MQTAHRLLLERDGECALLDAALDAAQAGRGSLLVIEGPYGIGKTCLLDYVRDRAMHGTPGPVRVLIARGGELESGFPFGVVRQLFEPWLLTASDERRAAVMSGPARLAAPLFDYDSGGPMVGTDAAGTQEVLHGLYWFAVNLAEESPLVVTIDDLQWADVYSLRFLSYLASRLDDKAISLVLAGRADEPSPHHDIMYAILASRAARVIRLKPLGEESVSELVSAELGRKPTAAFGQACHELTGGNPFFVREVLAELATVGVEPDDAGVGALRTRAPDGISRSVLRRLRRLPEPSVKLAEAVAILDTDGELRHAATLAGLDELTAVEAAGILVDAGILEPGAPLRFAYPIVRTAVYDGLPRTRRYRAHPRAARILTTGGAPIDQVARHLLHTPPSSDPWAVDMLRQAAGQALTRGTASTAVTYLRRALTEPAPPEVYPHLLAELGSAELRSREVAAIDHLTEALDLTTEATSRGWIGLDLGLALATAGRYDEALRVFGQISQEVENVDEDLFLRLEAEYISVAYLTPCTRQLAADRIDRLAGRIEGQRAPQRVLQAHVAYDALHRGERADVVIGLAERVLAEGTPLAERDSECQASAMVALVLAACDRLLDAERVVRDASQHADKHRLALAHSIASCVRAWVAFVRGRLGEAELHARTVLRGARLRGMPGSSVPYAAGVLLQTLMEREQIDQAARELDQLGYADVVPDSMAFGPVLEARARLRVALGRPEDGLADLDELRRRSVRSRARYPSLSGGGCHAIVGLARSGLVNEARTLAAEQLDLARSFGARRPLAVALRASGLVTGGSRGLEQLAEAAGLLDGSPASLERAHTLVELGAALRRAGRRADARRHLLAGAELAKSCDAAALRRHADAELAAVGVRMRVGTLALTPREQRVAHLAAEGMRNQEIARALFVTVKTVEWHLSQAYRKLGIESRADLRQALDGFSQAAS